MGAFSDLSIDIRERAELGRTEWAVLLNDEKRPASLWRVIGTARGWIYLEHVRFPVRVTVPECEAWIVA